MGTPEPIGQQGRWFHLLSEYDITIQHRPGRVHGNSDALSRCPCERTGDMECRQCRQPVSGSAESAGVKTPQPVSHEKPAGATAVQKSGTANSVPSVAC